MKRRAGTPDSAADMALRIVDVLARTEQQRTRLFRNYLQVTVCRVSPLLIDLSVIDGVALSEAVSLIQPPREWPWIPLDDHPPALIRRSQQRKNSLCSKGRNEGVMFERVFADPGVVIRGADHPRGRFGIRPVNNVLGFTAEIGVGCLLSAFSATAMLKFPEALPETLMLALPGRQLDAIVNHPIFRDAGYRIIRVQSDLADGMPVLTFRAPLIPFSLPALPDSALDGA